MVALRIGVGGPMGSGKSALCRLLEKRGYYRIDADQMAKGLIAADLVIQAGISAAFGADCVKQGVVDFARLAPRVFVSAGALAKYNSLVQPAIGEHVRKLVCSCPDALVLDAALLSVWGLDHCFDRLWWVDAAPKVRLGRMLKRSPHLSQEEITQRMDLQAALLPEPAMPPWVRIVNNDSLIELERFVATLLRKESV